MAQTASTWLMSEGQTVGRGYYSRDIVGDVPFGIVTGTERRDVSEQLDLLALAEIPFINSISWGPESGGDTIEWISEDLGPGKIAVLTSTRSAQASFVVTSIDGLAASQTLYQIKQGTVLYTFVSVSASHCLAVVTSTPMTGGTGTTIIVSWIEGSPVSMISDHMVYVVGAFANEGSIPQVPMPRQRVVCSNNFNILRQDVQITGTMKSTDMYAIGREDRHQILMRLKEMQRQRERAALYSVSKTKTSAFAGMMQGVLGFLLTQSGTHIDATTYTLTGTTMNTMVRFLWEYNQNAQLTFFGHVDQCAKFTRWDINRTRMRPNDRLGGGWITSWMSECGVEVDLIPMGHVPKNLAFVLDTSKIQLRAKRGRKAIMEKLGKMGDFDDWQILSEFTMEMKGYNLKQHGMFTVLT